MNHPQVKPLVLNVNDREANRYLVTKMLRQAAFEVIEAGTGADAVALARTHRPLVIVLDVKLPDFDGMEVCRRLRADPETVDIAVLHTSATYAPLEVKTAGLAAGSDGYLAQPFTSHELVATVRSLARIRIAQEEQRLRAERLAEADRRKNEYLAMLAHELRNPLAAISAAQSLLFKRPAADAREQRSREICTRQVNHVVRMIDDLLDVSRVTRGTIVLRRAALDLGALAARVAAVMEGEFAGRRQTLVVEAPEGTLFVNGDEDRLHQVIANLLANASRYSPEHARVRLNVAADGPEHVTVTVEDEGIGIDEADLPRVFDLFFQAHVGDTRRTGGLGVGLALVSSLTEQHGGTVAARSAGPGHGSTFVVRLSRVAALAPAADPSRTG